MVARMLAVLVMLAASCSPVGAQTPNLEPTHPNPSLPIISFEFALPGSNPPHYSIAVEPDGKASYRSDPLVGDNIAGEPYLQQFLVSEPTRKRIFALALALNCFRGNFEYHSGRIANTGAKTLKCAYVDHQSQTTYNYSTNPKLQELATIFQDISTTLEFGRRLTYLHRYDKLGLEAELKSMQDQARNKRLGELQAVAPQLQQILNDQAIINVTRRRAEQLLQLIRSDPAARAAAPQ